MIKFEKIKPGMTLWDVRKATIYTVRRSKWDIWPVLVKEIDIENRRVLALWNYNEPEWMRERRITKYRANRPEE